MRNKIVWLGMMLILFLGCKDIKNQIRNKDVVISAEDVQHFKKELEDLNEKNDIVVSVPDSSRIVIADEDDILQLQNGIVLFGWPSCPWFRNAVGPLLEFSAEEKATIYYLNIKDIRDFKELQDDEVVTTEEGSAGYRAILEKFHDILNPYTVLGIDSIKRISSPTVLFIENGKGTHKVVSTVVSHTDSHTTLTPEQQQELKARYQAYFTKR
ncbi:hypothetical protein FXV77_15860 [Sphingobacterium phlebotomi]|uniref:Thioredoxin domain-containing protein n=1 Tax=Sphingobacterium phlebotomi TaxID=2605433 RepID=A0A5D4H0D6_9SPHI|nr:hypothetical protein [Sphingobacterium phlebotomi]TYR34491.1 hypothetical protein FXV77_15860 [Sphingobacterium phlebotomi]